MRFSLVLVAALAVLAACAKKNTDPNGVGPWQFGKTTLADAEPAGRCLPIEGGLMQCIGLSSMQVGGQTAGTELYFASKAKDAKLVEISLSVKACDAPSVANDLSTRIGPPKVQALGGSKLTWTLSTMYVRALVPDKQSGECLVNFVLPSDAERIKQLEADK